MPSAFSWPVLVPSALRAPAPVNLGVRPCIAAMAVNSKTTDPANYFLVEMDAYHLSLCHGKNAQIYSIHLTNEAGINRKLEAGQSWCAVHLFNQG